MNTFKPNMTIHQQSSQDTIMAVSEDFMTSPTGDSHPTFRAGHFLKPMAKSVHELTLNELTLNQSYTLSVSESNEPCYEIQFNGWRYHPLVKWVTWVDQLQLKYESVWKKAGIFEAIMSTKSHIINNKDLVYGVVEKWCSETNTFVFPFGEATITLEDVMVLGGYPVLGDPIFTSLEDQEMREAEKKLIVATHERTKRSISSWIDSFINKGSEIEHEAFLASWLSSFVFPNKYFVVKRSLFPIAVKLARGNTIALAPAVLASLYKDLSVFKEKIVGLKQRSVGRDKLPLVFEVNVQSPFYLVQVWVWERFQNLQPQPNLINNGDPLLLRWHMVKASKIDKVSLALDSSIDDFIWRPYVRYADKCGLFYPNVETLVPVKDDLDKNMLSFVTCLRVSELVGFDSIEKYLPHRVAMQFGLDQSVPGYVPRVNATEAIAWENYCRPISDTNLYFPARLFEADVTTHYAKWWKKLILGRGDFVKNIVRKKRTPGLRKRRSFVGKANKSGYDIGVPPGFPPNLVHFLTFEKIVDYGSKNSVANCSQMTNHNTPVPSMNLEDSNHVSKDNIGISVGSLEEDSNHANGSKEAEMSSDKVCSSETNGKSCSNAIGNNVSSSNNITANLHDVPVLFDNVAQVEAKETVEEKEREENDHEVVVLLKEQNLKIQEELARLARQQEEMLRLMESREKRDEELRQLLISALRNQLPPPSSS